MIRNCGTYLNEKLTLLAALIETLHLGSDAELSSLLEVYPLVISGIRGWRIFVNPHT